MEKNTFDDMQAVSEAAKYIRQGKLVAIPTETVYGLGANALDAAAVEQIYAVKGRPGDNPLIVHIASMEMLHQVASVVPDTALDLGERFWPGPLTMVLPKSSLVPDAVTRGLDTVAVRWPAHPLAQAVIQAAQTPVAAPSANLSGYPSPTTAQHVQQDLGDKVDFILDGGACTMGIESTVVSLVHRPARLLRPGMVTQEQLTEVLGEVEIDPGVLAALTRRAPAESPGMKHKHYSPKCRVILLDGDSQAYVEYVNAKRQKKPRIAALCYREEAPSLQSEKVVLGGKDDSREQIQGLFRCLRELDDIGAETAYAHLPKAFGLGLALRNRLLRAANFQVIALMGKENPTNGN